MLTPGVIALYAAGALAAANTAAVEGRIGSDLFVFGGAVTVPEPVRSDLFAAGGAVDVEAPVAGDAVAAGGRVRFGADVGQSIYAAGGQLEFTGKVGRNLRVAGGRVEVAKGAEIAGNVSMAGGRLRLLGPVRGQVQAAGGRLLIDAPVGGDVIAGAGAIELGPNARIAGKLRYQSGEPLVRHVSAEVAGGVEEETDAKAVPRERAAPRWHLPGWPWTLGLIVLAALLLAASPGFYTGVTQTLRERTAASALAGFVWLVCVPVVTLFFVLTIIGIPIALLAVALYLALLPVGYVSAAIAFGGWSLQRMRPDAAAALPWRIGAAALALVLLALLGMVPWLGGWVGFVVLLLGLGALVLQLPWLRSRGTAHPA
jgi:hypothetical protein